RSLEGETDRPSRAALAEALYDAGVLYSQVDAPDRGKKAVEALRAAQALRTSLVREQPGDSSMRRELGRIHLTLAMVGGAGAQAVLGPRAGEHPDDGSARQLEAECDSFEGQRLMFLGRPVEARAVLARARGLYEALIRDNPPFNPPTGAVAETERPLLFNP